MALGIANQVGFAPTALFVGQAIKIGRKPFGGIPQVAVVIPPKQHSIIGQFLFFGIVGEVFQNDEGCFVVGPNLVVNAFPDVHAAFIVCAPGRDITPRFFLGKAFGEVKPEPVEAVFLQPIAIYPLH